MLFITFEQDIELKAQKLLEAAVKERTGEDCIVLGCGCTGVYNVPLTKEKSKRTSE